MNSLNSKLNVGPAPHWSAGNSVSRTQLFWILALLPAILSSLWFFQIQALRIYLLCLGISLAMDLISELIVPSKDSPQNWSSITFGLLFAMLLPLNAPWWLIVVGCFIMIVIGKKLFGGLGAYPVHPVLLSLAILLVSWPYRLDYTAAMISLDWSMPLIEPLRLIKTQGSSVEQLFNRMDLFLGKQAAGIGNGMVLFLLLGGLFLLLSRQITWHIPVGFLIGTLGTAWIFHQLNPAQFATPLFHFLSGSTIFGAFFLATEYTTSPVNRIPMLLYGLLGGILLLIIRSFSVYYDGIAFTVLLLNLSHPLLDRISPKVIGMEEVQNA